MSNIFCNLELCKQIKLLGIPQRTKYYWIKNNSQNEPYSIINSKTFRNFWNVENIQNCSNIWSAFTSSELMEILPASLAVENKIYTLRINKRKRDIPYYEVNYFTEEIKIVKGRMINPPPLKKNPIWSAVLHDGLGKMLVFILKEFPKAVERKILINKEPENE